MDGAVPARRATDGRGNWSRLAHMITVRGIRPRAVRGESRGGKDRGGGGERRGV